MGEAFQECPRTELPPGNSARDRGGPLRRQGQGPMKLLRRLVQTLAIKGQPKQRFEHPLRWQFRKHYARPRHCRWRLGCSICQKGLFSGRNTTGRADLDASSTAAMLLNSRAKLLRHVAGMSQPKTPQLPPFTQFTHLAASALRSGYAGCPR